MSARKARASELLAALQADRFLLHKEADLIALDIPSELRSETRNHALRERKKRPYNPDHFPNLSSAASDYFHMLSTARRESNHSNNFRAKHLATVKAYYKKQEVRSIFDKPLPDGELAERFRWHGQHIVNWVHTLQNAWDKLSDTEKLWFEDMPPLVRWAWDFPGLAPAPQCFYPTEETPERLRQMELLRWVIENRGDEK